jgi:hypothetical protein
MKRDPDQSARLWGELRKEGKRGASLAAHTSFPTAALFDKDKPEFVA